MNALLFSSIQTAAYGNLFECSTHSETIEDVVFSSMSHRNEVGVWDEGKALLLVSMLNTEGLKATFPKYATEDGLVIRHSKNDLTDHLPVLGWVFRAAATLPPDPSAVLPARTEAQSVVRTRLGQHRYKTAQAALWGDACAVTGIRQPELLRASHAKPWADSSDSERLDPANGLTLVVHLDALFDAGFISFGEEGKMILSPQLDSDVVAAYGLSHELGLRLPLSPVQQAFMAYHRDHVFKGAAGTCRRSN